MIYTYIYVCFNSCFEQGLGVYHQEFHSEKVYRIDEEVKLIKIFHNKRVHRIDEEIKLI